VSLEILITAGIFFALSLMANVFFIWYTRKAITRLLYISGTLSDLRDMVSVFRNHLEALHALETFYGDQTIQFLLQHANDLAEQLKEYEDLYLLSIEPPEEEDDRDSTEGDPEYGATEDEENEER
jgi:hypothetical protein